jgi:hypothetical protein
MNAPENREDSLARGGLDAIDDAVLAQLRAALEAIDPVPSTLTDEVKFRLSVAALEADIAEIVATSSELAGVRGTSYDRATSVTFTSGALSAMVTIDEQASGAASITGWTSEGGVEVELRERSRTRTSISDAHGRFSFADVQRGLVHFVFRHGSAGVAPVITPAIEI